MKKFLSTQYSETSFNLMTFVLRVVFGGLIILLHGLPKLNHFSQQSSVFFDPFHIGHKASLCLVIFSEVGCGVLVLLGLLTRLAALVLVIELAIAVLLFHKGQPLANHDAAIVYLAGFFAIL